MADYQTGRDLHIDAVLSNIMIGRRPNGWIADQLVPVLGVSKRSDIYYKIDHKQFRAYVAGLTNRAPMTEARKVKFIVSSDTFYAKNYALGADWPAEDQANADDGIQIAQTHAELVTDILLNDFEVRVANLANTSTSVFSTTHVSTAWSNSTGSRPLDDLGDQIEYFRLQNGLKPNVMLAPEEVMVKLRRSDQVRDRLFGDRGGQPTDAQIASLLNVPKLLVPSALVNSAGVAATLAGSGEMHAAWAKKVWLMYITPLPGRMIDTWAQAFRWTNPDFGVPFAVQRYPFDAKKKAYSLEAGYYQDEKIISSELAFAVDSVI